MPDFFFLFLLRIHIVHKLRGFLHWQDFAYSCMHASRQHNADCCTHTHTHTHEDTCYAAARSYPYQQHMSSIAAHTFCYFVGSSPNCCSGEYIVLYVGCYLGFLRFAIVVAAAVVVGVVVVSVQFCPFLL